MTKDLPVHCQVVDPFCENWVDLDTDYADWKSGDWPFSIKLWVCPKHYGMIVALADKVTDERA